uniref:Peptidase inhibitor 16 n=1 Tax=Apteryx owenii TaxID=8824 RepID=A0A8B9PFF2_APTOW
MLSSGLSPVFLLFTALELSWSLSDEEKKIIVDGHNKYRSQVSPPAMDMLKMSWDTELEAFAQAYAEKCIWDHNKERGRRGENLFAMTPTLDLEFAVEDWNGEEKYYNLTTTTCAPGQMCGHYTQVVWASTHRIGCGVKFCAKIDGIETEDMYLLVCNYYPPGNMKGRKPYKEGASCSQCPEGTLCVNSLQAIGTDTPGLGPSSEPSWSHQKALGWQLQGCMDHETGDGSPETGQLPRTRRIEQGPCTPSQRLLPQEDAPSLRDRAPKLTTTAPVPTTMMTTLQQKPTTTTKPALTKTERSSPTEAAGLTLSFEPTLDLDYKISPDTEAGTGEPLTPLTTEDPALLEMGTAFSPKSVPETNKDVKESGREKPVFSFSSPSPSLSQIIPEIKLGFNKTELITPSKSVVFSPEEPTFLRLTSSSKETKGQSPAFQTSLSGKVIVESVLAWTHRC